MYTLTLFLGAFALWILWRVKSVQNSIKNISHVPHLWTLSPIFSLATFLLPTMKLNPGMNWQWNWRNTLYGRLEADTFSIVPLVSGTGEVVTRSPEVARQILSSSAFCKSEMSTAGLREWGHNVVTTNGDDHTRHKRIVKPAFSFQSYALVWKETLKTYSDMIESEGWTGSSFVVPSINHIMGKFALIIIGRCGYGLPLSWGSGLDSHTSSKSEKSMSFAAALEAAARGLITRLVTPQWAYYLPIRHLRHVDSSYKSLTVMMRDLVNEKRNAGVRERDDKSGDLLDCLVRANSEEEKWKLSDEEMLSNMFVLFIAGHETTAHTLSATLALLALYPAEQDIVYAQIKEVLGAAKDPSFDDVSKYDKVMACFYEAARMFPATLILTRTATQSVVLTLEDHPRARTEVVLREGTDMHIDLVGLHYNPRVFPSPEEFRPSRWYGKSDAELSFFGYGPKSCLGRKFVTTEALGALVLLLRDYKLKPIKEGAESDAMWRERFLQGSLRGLAFGIRDTPLRFLKR